MAYAVGYKPPVRSHSRSHSHSRHRRSSGDNTDVQVIEPASAIILLSVYLSIIYLCLA
jgi:hypothetical protein